MKLHMSVSNNFTNGKHDNKNFNKKQLRIISFIFYFQYSIIHDESSADESSNVKFDLVYQKIN